MSEQTQDKVSTLVDFIENGKNANKKNQNYWQNNQDEYKKAYMTAVEAFLNKFKDGKYTGTGKSAEQKKRLEDMYQVLKQAQEVHKKGSVYGIHVDIDINDLTNLVDKDGTAFETWKENMNKQVEAKKAKIVEENQAKLVEENQTKINYEISKNANDTNVNNKNHVNFNKLAQDKNNNNHFESANKTNKEELYAANCLTMLDSMVDQITDKDVKSRLQDDLSKYNEIPNVIDKAEAVGRYLKSHQNLFKTNQELLDDIERRGTNILKDAVEKISTINTALADQKSQMYQDIESEGQFGDRIRKINKEILEIDEQIDIVEHIKDWFGCSTLCDQLREAQEQKQALKQRMAAIKNRFIGFEDAQLEGDSMLKAAMINSISNNHSQVKDANWITADRLKGMQIFQTKKSNNYFNSNANLPSNKNITGYLGM